MLLLKPTEVAQHDISELFHVRRKESSTIFCSQYHDSGWYDQLGGDNSPLAEAILGRIKHDAYKINNCPHRWLTSKAGMVLEGKQAQTTFGRHSYSMVRESRLGDLEKRNENLQSQLQEASDKLTIVNNSLENSQKEYVAILGRDRRKFCVIDEPRQYENFRLSQE